VAESWQRQAWPLRILRAFLGVTFVYAGIQKLADPNFLHPGTPDFIGSQLQGFAQGSPIHGLLAVAERVPALVGVAVALTEVAVGLGTLLGIGPLVWAATGFVVNLALFLSATWHVHPYFLGSDSIYAVAWLAFLVGEIEVEREAARALTLHGTRRQRAALHQAGMGRREFLRAALLGVGTVVVGAAASAFGQTTRPAAGLARSPSTGPTPALGHEVKPSTPTGIPVAKLSDVPIGGAVSFHDPGQGPGVLVRLAKERVSAFSRVCTHAGCLVEYDQQQRILFCPCHGAEFDPTQGGQVIAGPAPAPLAAIQVAIDRSTGEVVAAS